MPTRRVNPNIKLVIFPIALLLEAFAVSRKDSAIRQDNCADFTKVVLLVDQRPPITENARETRVGCPQT